MDGTLRRARRVISRPPKAKFALGIPLTSPLRVALHHARPAPAGRADALFKARPGKRRHDLERGRGGKLKLTPRGVAN